MPYIGNSPANIGNYQIVDDISSGFDNVTTTFALTAASQTINPAKSGQLLVSINGVLQEPDDTGTEGFLVSGSNIVFSSAPATGSTFWCVFQGQNVDIGTPSNATVGTAQLSATGTPNTSTFLRGDNTWVTPTDTDTTTTLSVAANILTYTDETGTDTDIDLSLYLDDTNAAYISSGSLNGSTGVATFTRSDATSFDVDMSALLDDTTVTVNNTLTSTSTTEALSAAQGKALNTRVLLNDAKVSNVAHPLVETAVPVGALFTDTDTVYSHPATHPASMLTGALPAIDGSALTGIDAATVSATAPSSPAQGDMWFDTTTGTTSMKVWSGSDWDTMSNKFSATGGTESTYSSGGINYKVHTFTSSGTFTPTAAGTVDYLVIAGGAGGHDVNGRGGGGGAGGYRTSAGTSGGGASAESSITVSAQAYSVTVGGGGARNANGANSIFSTITSIGGGTGGNQSGSVQGQSGGSGGGAGGDRPGTHGAGTTGQGYRGGYCGGTQWYSSAGGGGAGQAGLTSLHDEFEMTASSQYGGNGVASTITGTSITRAGGGGGLWYSGTSNFYPLGGSGGGGRGGRAIKQANALAGTVNTGSGGGGGDTRGPSYGGSGGSGIVIIRYAV